MSSSKPATVGELQLYKVLQRANLLSYYESFICQGGDDVQQLCEAGEEEFLEIMALVGMACKPLHVRRLQKSLQEWVTRPSLFRSTNPSLQYLPAQSIPLTSVGLDVRDLPMPPQAIHTSASRPKTGGPAYSTPRSLNGNTNVFKLHNSSKRHNGHAMRNNGNEDKEIGENDVSVVLDGIVQKYVSHSRLSPFANDVISQLAADKSFKDIIMALRTDDNNLLETLVTEFVGKDITIVAGSSARHEKLVREAAVKLCLSDQRFLIKKSELSSAAEKIACDVELNMSRRSSMYLHGSTNQSNTRQTDQSLHNVQDQDTVLGRIQDSNRQSNPNSLTSEELSTSPGKRESQKISKHTTDNTASTLDSFSSDLADLAKAHNLSLGNLQSMPSASELQSSNGPRENSKCRSPPQLVQGTEDEKESTRTSQCTRSVRSGKRKLSSGSRDLDEIKKLVTDVES